MNLREVGVGVNVQRVEQESDLDLQTGRPAVETSASGLVIRFRRPATLLVARGCFRLLIPDLPELQAAMQVLWKERRLPDGYAVVTEVVQALGFAAIVSEKDGTLVVAAPPGEKINGIRDLADPERALSIVEQRDLAVTVVGQRDGPVMFRLWPTSP